MAPYYVPHPQRASRFFVESLVQAEVNNALDWGIFADFQDWNSAVTGSAATSSSDRVAKINTGNTASSTGRLRSQDESGFESGRTPAQIDWAKQKVFAFKLSLIEGTTNGILRWTVGKSELAGVGALGDSGVGFEVRNAALHGIVHNGTTGASVDLSTTLVSRETVRLILDTNAGTVEWFVDGVSKGTSSAGPAVADTGGLSVMQFEADNGGDTDNEYGFIFPIRWVGVQ